MWPRLDVAGLNAKAAFELVVLFVKYEHNCIAEVLNMLNHKHQCKKLSSVWFVVFHF